MTGRRAARQTVLRCLITDYFIYYVGLGYPVGRDTRRIEQNVSQSAAALCPENRAVRQRVLFARLCTRRTEMTSRDLRRPPPGPLATDAYRRNDIRRAPFRHPGVLPTYRQWRSRDSGPPNDSTLHFSAVSPSRL